jgi:DNA-directed RNA polymerase subunit RPC12/RpoP
MIERTIMEDLSERTGYTIVMDDLPPDIKAEIKDLMKIYKKMIRIKNEITIKQKELNKPRLPFMKKTSITKGEISYERNELKKMEEEYERSANKISEDILRSFKRRFEAKEGIQRNINVNVSDVISAIKENQMHTCPKCGAPLVVDKEKGVLVCEYCGSKYKMIEDVLKEIV